MSNDNDDDPEISLEIELDYEDFDDELVAQFSDAIENTINNIFDDNISKDGRLELITVLLSIASQLAIDIELSSDYYADIACDFYEEAAKAISSEIDISKLN